MRKPKEPAERNVEAMNRIVGIYVAHPYYGYRRIHAVLADQISIGRDHVLHLMHRMGICAVYPKRNLSKRYQKQYIRPYLPKGLEITHPDQVWSVDITYIRMRKGFMYLFAIIDACSRYIVVWELPGTLEKESVIRGLHRGYRSGCPEIQNSDQGGHFTNGDYTALVEGKGIRISMDGRRRALDNIFVERFFRTLKYEEIYLNEYGSPRMLRKALERYIGFYNDERLHQSLGYRSPREYYHPGRMKTTQWA
jgi:putative transposase